MGNFFSSNVKYIRNALGLSRSELAKKLNVHQSTISRWETGEMGATVENAIDMSKALDIPLPELVGKNMAEENYCLNNIQNEYALLFDKYKDLKPEDKELIVNLIETRKNQIDKEKGED